MKKVNRLFNFAARELVIVNYFSLMVGLDFWWSYRQRRAVVVAVGAAKFHNK